MPGALDRAQVGAELGFALRLQVVQHDHHGRHKAGTLEHGGQRVEAFETVRVRKNGARIDVLLSLSPMFDDAGQVIGLSAITRDITGEEVYSTIYAIDESPVEQGVIWVGANDGPVSVTRDGGKTWEQPGSPTGAMEVDPASGMP